MYICVPKTFDMKVICLNECLKRFLICWYSISYFLFGLHSFTVERRLTSFYKFISFLASKPIILLLAIFKQDNRPSKKKKKYLLGHSWKLLPGIGISKSGPSHLVRIPERQLAFHSGLDFSPNTQENQENCSV